VPSRHIEIQRSDVAPDDYVLKGWIGINAQGIQLPPRFRDGEIYLRYMEYPKVLTVDANSPAARAGILKGDLLVAYDGEDLREREVNLTRLLVPLRQLRVTVDRSGERLDYPLVVAKAPQSLLVRRMESGLVQFDDSVSPPQVRAWAGARAGGGAGGRSGPAAGGRGTMEPMARGGRILVLPAEPFDSATRPVAPPRPMLFMRNDVLLGAQAVVVDAELGENFGVDAGVLLTHVMDVSPARNSGLRSGDVIVRANGEDITSLTQLRRIIASAGDDRHVDVKVVRQRKPMTLTLRW
jgi:predicted metalloprotease with PDZ domain